MSRLTNGICVVGSSAWVNGSATNAGAATWGNGATGTSGAISAANSLVGTTANEFVGGTVRALSNGNYVVSTANWDNGAVLNVGAVTWCNALLPAGERCRTRTVSKPLAGACSICQASICWRTSW